MDSPIEKLRYSCETLLNAVETSENGVSIDSYVAQFISTIEDAMDAYKAGKIKVDMDTLPKIMYMFATEELPTLCNCESVDLENIRRQLKLFLVTMQQLVKPEYVE
ncbi:MAG: hypothetical protein ACTSUO_09175 [Candidatus Thorarchaeota archaeon]